MQHQSKHSFVQNKRQYLCQSQNLCCCYCVNLVNEETSTCVNTFTENRKLDVQKCFSGILRDKVSSNLQSGGHQLVFLRIWLTQQPLQKKNVCTHLFRHDFPMCIVIFVFCVLKKIESWIHVFLYIYKMNRELNMLSISGQLLTLVSTLQFMHL